VRNYDPLTGRFISEDPAEQLLNPYVFSNNNPVMFADPDGEFFGLIGGLVSWAASNTMIVAAAQASAISTGISASIQLATTGEINMSALGAAALTGFVSGGLNNFVGGAFQPGLMKTLAHGGVGGLTSSMSGGSFWNGFGAGAFAEITSGLVDGIDTSNSGISLARTASAGILGGTASAIGGGNFWTGFGIGAAQRLFNHDEPNHKNHEQGTIEETMEHNMRMSMKDYHREYDPKVAEFAKKHNLDWKVATSAGSFVISRMSGFGFIGTVVVKTFLSPLGSPRYFNDSDTVNESP